MIDKSNFIKAVAKKLLSVNYTPKKIKLSEKQLKSLEAEIGAAIFGPIAPNERRAFFNDNRESWFFHQEKTDAMRNKHSITLHYEVRPEGILRVSNQASMKCEMISGQELDNFIKATEIYYSHVMSKIYKKTTNPKNTL